MGMIRTYAYPKVNIGLYIGQRTAEGYHSLISIFQKVYNICDEVSVSFEESENVSVEVSGLEKCALETDNTCCKAAKLFMEKSGLTGNVRIDVIKGIPDRAGLGGGSSDAASVLLALQELAGNCLSDEDLHKCALAVGSDVPFFMYGCDAAVVSGRGETVVPIKARTDLKFSLIRSFIPKPGTGQAYAVLDSLGVREILPSADYLLDMYKRPVSQWAFENDFEKINSRPGGVEEGNGRLYLSGAGNMWYLVQDSSD